MAVQHIMAAHHRIERWTLREFLRQIRERLGGLAMEKSVTHEVDELVHAAFERSWQFVRSDPVLAHGDMEELRIRLSKRLQRLAQHGERDMWRLANNAIGELRRELTAA